MWKRKSSDRKSSEKRKTGRNEALAFALLALALSGPAASAQTPDAPKTPDAPQSDGALALPTAPPPTGLQAPVPPPAAPLTKADKPLRTSPTLAELASYLQTHPLTINDAVAISLATNRTLATANAALLNAQGRTSEARAAFNPTLGVNYQFLTLSQASNANIGGREELSRQRTSFRTRSARPRPCR